MSGTRIRIWAPPVNAGAAGLLRHVPLPARWVCQITVPPAARALSTLARIDYEDAFLADMAGARERTGEEWARAVLADAPLATRSALSRGWSALGLKLGPRGSEDLVLGWEVRASEPDFALLGAGSRLGFEGEVLFWRRTHALLFATFVHLRTPVARGVWAGIGPGHRQAVRYLLGQAVARHAPRPR